MKKYITFDDDGNIDGSIETDDLRLDISKYKHIIDSDEIKNVKEVLSNMDIFKIVSDKGKLKVLKK